MIRATTPTHTFLFKDLDPSSFKVLNIYYAQQGKELLLKTKDDCTFDNTETDDGIIYEAQVTLSQAETKLFNARHDVEVQLRILTYDDKALATCKYKLPIHDVINDEELV